MTGMFILSLDTEIAWGTYGETEIERHRHSFETIRDIIRRLLDLLDKYEIPATWAVVGHLFLESCSGHPDVLQPSYSWMTGPDSDRDPCSDLDHAPWYYAPDVIAMIRAAHVNHEIGSHTFTHVLAGDPAVTAGVWDSQLAACVTLHAQQGLTLRSLVYPRNQIAYTERLSLYGITAYRGVGLDWHRHYSGWLARCCRLLDHILALPSPTYDLATLGINEQPANLPASKFLVGYEGLRRWIPASLRLLQVRRSLDRAARHSQLYHLWFHPFNLGASPPLFETLESIFKEVARRRDKGQLDVMTMQQAAEWILSREKQAITPSPVGGPRDGRSGYS